MIRVTNEVEFTTVINVIKLTRSAIIIQLVILFVATAFLYEYVPYDYLILWFGLHVINYLGRWFLNDIFLSLPNNEHGYSAVEKYLKYYLAGLFNSSLLWGMSILFFEYIPLIYQYSIYYILIGFTFGAVLSIGPIIEMFFAYILPMNLFALGYLFYHYKESDSIIILFIVATVLYAFRITRTYVRFYTSLIEVKHELQEKLREIEIKEYNKQQYLKMIDEIGIGMIVTDEENRILHVNNTIEEWFGDFTGKDYYEFLNEISKYPVDENVMEVVTKANIVYEIISNEYQGLDHNSFRVYVFKDISKEIYQRDVLNRLAMQYKQKAEYDPLTQLLNRNAFESVLEKAFYEADRKFFKLAILFIDLDNFKYINDTYGHQAGDTVLKIIAKRLKNSVKQKDIKARYAGDEFVIVLKGVEDRKKIEEIAQGVLRVISEPISLDDNIKVSVSASIGIACYPDDAKTFQGLLEKADKTMYEVKRHSKNNIAFYTHKEA